jgi:hypothetical protein
MRHSLSEYINIKESINDEIIDKYLDYCDKIEDNVNFHKQSVLDLNNALVINRK